MSKKAKPGDVLPVENLQRRSSANRRYNFVLLRVGQQTVPHLFSDDALHVARERAKRNPEDFADLL